jgi:UDP-GlcNAc3NAcA epimerase
MRRILTVIGARPQIIKAAPVSAALRQAGAQELLVHTGQHYDANMSDIFFQELGLPAPWRHLGIGSGTHGAQTGAMLAALETVMAEARPDWVLVYGDTNSTLAGALAAAKLHLPIAHVEAGLRSFNRLMPEEINRVLTDHMATLLLVPTDQAVACLRAEGIAGTQVQQVGDVMFDAALGFAALARTRSGILERLELRAKGYVLATLHRAENTDHPQRLGAILDGLAQVARTLPVLLPLHPRTRRILHDAGRSVPEGGIRVMEPVGYLDMVALERNAAVIATDSGGVQKEAFFHRVPCVTLRNETEWTELVALGWNRLQPPDSPEAVAAAVRAALGSSGQEGTPYGDGQTAPSIAALLTGSPR